MRTSRRGLIAVLLATLGGACEPTVVIERDEIHPIPAGATWAWSGADGDGLSAAQGNVNPDADVTIAMMDAITANLEAKGFRLTTVDSAQFFVHFHLGQREIVDTLPPLHETRGVTDRDGQGWGRYGDPESVRQRTMVWQEGMLIVDVLTGDGRSVAWRGIISGEVKTAARENPRAAVTTAVGKLLAEFP